MANEVEMIVLPPSFPVGACFGSSQDLANQIAYGLRVLLPSDVSFFIYGPNEPTVEQRAYVWVKTEATNNTIIGIYKWSPMYGAWVQNHWMLHGGSPPTYERRIFSGTTTQLASYDGGESGAVTDTTGAFWEVDSNFTDRWMIGVGAVVATVGGTAQVFDVGTPADPKAVGVYIIKPTGRIYDRGS